MNIQTRRISEIRASMFMGSPRKDENVWVLIEDTESLGVLEYAKGLKKTIAEARCDGLDTILPRFHLGF